VQLADGSVVQMDDTAQQLILLRLHEMSAKGLRCLGLAFKDDLGELDDYSSETHPSHSMLNDPTNYSKIESHLVFVAIVGLRVSLSPVCQLPFLFCLNLSNAF
jgi:Ca2+-transporting ATPase